MKRAQCFSAVLLAVFSVPVSGADDAALVTTGIRHVPAYLLEVPDSISNILIADVETSTMHRFVRRGDRIVAQDRRFMSIGENGPGKVRAWDRKTPLGVYFITESLDTSRMDERYGVAAFPLDYPNAWDRFNERTGYGIWLHGVDHSSPERPAWDTDGCLALPNAELKMLMGHLEPLVTPVIVAREMDWALPADLDALRLELRLVLDRWRESLAKGDLLNYLSLYADDFRYRDMDRAAWSSYRLGVFQARRLVDVALENIFLVADPEVPHLYLSRFTQVLMTADGPVRTTKRLYWRRTADTRWQIVAEDSG